MIEGHLGGVNLAFDFLHSLPGSGERIAKVFECSYLFQWHSFEEELSLLQDNHLSRKNLLPGGVNAQIDSHSKVFNPFRSNLHGFEAKL